MIKTEQKIALIRKIAQVEDIEEKKFLAINLSVLTIITIHKQ